MNDTIDRTGDEDIFIIAVSDEALEAAAGVGTENAQAFTAALCTVMADCSS